ncbi:ATP-binding protein [uncultured Cardiobacterium sp.]|uniref:ATP-binding protein n=1 Tax=uncultured Cardiobacterium sp. TaxID=417619 RepID=UPI0026252BCB|nr:ATP-binding protein [uncultured Cardiobacterium sp.]
MTIFVRLFLVYGLVLTLGGALLMRDVQQQLRPGMRQVLEDTLADNAQILAAALAPALKDGSIRDPARQAALRADLARPRDIHIYQNHKTANHQQLIITDAKGIVLYHSDPLETGKDYSRWNDILRTLRGEYGARSSHGADGSTMYVAAPIRDEAGRLLGVVSLGKPSADILPYQAETQHKLRRSGALYLAASLALIALLTLWIRRSINLVRRYATAHAPIPPAPRFHLASELNRLTAAIGNMRRELEDRDYVTRYIETLTHELKSPLTAITTSAELLQDDLPAADRARFAANIAQQSNRLHELVRRLLELSRLEKDPLHKQPLDIAALWHKLLRAQHARLAQKHLSFRENITVEKEPPPWPLPAKTQAFLRVPGGRGWSGGSEKTAAHSPTHDADAVEKNIFPEESERGKTQTATTKEDSQKNTTDTALKPPLTLNADPFWLEQTLANLLDNAIRAAPDGSTLTFTAAQTRSHITLSLHNPTTAPIPAYALPRLFERYYTLNRKENSGLGLTLVAETMQRHGGSATAENHADGLRITLTFPR